MRFDFLRLPLAISLAPLAAALQSIYLATVGSSAGIGYIAFFTDSDPCSDSTRPFGYEPLGFHYCDQDLTVLGHANVSFTGCPPNDGTYPPPNVLPTGVADGGAPALTCAPAPAPTDGSLFAECPYPPVNPVTRVVGGVLLLEYCG